MVDDGRILALLAVAGLAAAGAARERARLPPTPYPLPPGSHGIVRSRTRRQSQHDILARTGDVNPFDYGGGVVFRDLQRFAWWSWEGQDEEVGDKGARTYQVWQVNVPDDVLGEVRWVDEANLVSMARFLGRDVKDLRRMSKSKDVRERVRLLEDIGDYYGMADFDDQPVDYTQDELIELFPELA